MSTTCSPGSHPHADQPNWKPSSEIADYLENCRAGLEEFSERQVAKRLGWSRIAVWRSTMMAKIPEDLFEQLLAGRTSARELAMVGALFGDGTAHGREMECCPNCGCVLRVRSTISPEATAILSDWLDCHGRAPE